VSWAFREFVQKTVATAGTRIADAPIWMGAKSQVGLVVQDDLTLLLPSLAQDNLKAEVTYAAPIEAPVEAGQELARMAIEIPGHDPVVVPLVAEEAVAKGGFATRLKTAFGILSAGAMTEFAN
jgi:D-alanyl-D-alanine carboxypeptidase (penicillin-binding protein 5/6)